MTTKKTVVENTKPLAEPAVAPPENGAQPDPVLNTGEKAITLVELNKDLVMLNQGLANLQRQVFSQMGAIQYVQQKIAELNKVEVEKGK